nr:GGDEF domain-containing protein [Streptomyces sp. HUCO-GS316]
MGPLIVLADVGGIRHQPENVTVILGLGAALSLLLVLRIAFLAQYAQGRATEARTQACALADSLREQAELQKQLHHQATHDPLTGLANRALLNERLESALTRCTATSAAGLLMLDLDGFKDVNDTLGHPAGDELLVDVARRLTARVREQDLVARLGGDEFALLVDGVHPRTLHDYTTRILDAFKDPFILAQGHPVHVSTSIGARSITQPTPPSHAMRDADTALYRAKTAGKNQAAFFETSPSHDSPGASHEPGDPGSG